MSPTQYVVKETIKLNADGTNYPEWSDHVEQKICQQKLRKYLTSSTRFHPPRQPQMLLRRELSTLTWKPNETYATFVHRFQECVRKMFEAGDMTPEADRIVEFLYLLPSSFEAKVDSILEHIAKNDPEYCSLIAVIKSVEIVADRIAHTSKTNASASKVRGTDEAYHTEAGDKFCTYCEWKGHDLSECRNKKRDEANARLRQKHSGNPWRGGNMPVFQRF
ncbi:hypothetical protein DYB32_007322 [Aphanomyces invadans]|uniref:Uncharacterized protein n=1 Tax=Aphanomyces invadans TaxID=157072 RepID=A0A3R6V792_9STRA|nr:hypothetical protein DYB32_007322 [Aphanomyces invadans]